jgi:hypothetical protein
MKVSVTLDGMKAIHEKIGWAGIETLRRVSYLQAGAIRILAEEEMLEDYLKVRGVGDLVAGGTALVLVTMAAYYLGYAIQTDFDIVSYFDLQDYLRLSIAFIPILALPFIGAGLLVLATRKPYFTSGAKDTVHMNTWVRYARLMVWSITAGFLSYAILLLTMGSDDHFFIFKIVAPLILLVPFMRLSYDISKLGLFCVLSLLWLYASLGSGLLVSHDITNLKSPAVAVHVNYLDEPIEGNILINLSNTLLLSEPGSTSYTAISQSEIRSIDRLGD